MPFTRDALTRWLESAGTTAEDESAELRQRISHAFEHEIGRVPDRATVDGFISDVEDGQSLAEVHLRLRSSLEHFSRAGNWGPTASYVFRILAALGDSARMPVAPELIAECVALYRLLLGRDPDPDGFRRFVDQRRDHPLIASAHEIAGSPEAKEHHAPHSPPGANEAALLAVAMTPSLLNSVSVDIASARLDRVEKVLESIEDLVTRLSATVALRIDVGQS